MIDKKLLEAAVNWWVDQISGHKLNWDNGAQNEGTPEDREIGFRMWALGNFAANNAREKITSEQIETFKKSLLEQIEGEFEKFEEYQKYAVNSREFKIILSVDYHPGEYLREAADEAEIDTAVFPCKTVMWIDNKQVSYRLGYGAEQKLLIGL